MPTASVVFIFKNERWSPVLRSVYSVLHRSPKHLLKEIILVDDQSDIEEMKQKIENQSILTNEIFGSHPYKPIYFTLYSYCRELDVTDIEQSWDYEQFIQFFVIMNEMVEKMAVNLNTPDKNENMNAKL